PVKVKVFPHILLQVCAGDSDAGGAALKLKIHEAIHRRWLVKLSDLIILWRIGIEVVFAVKLCVAGDRAVEKIAGERGEAERLLVCYRQHARQAKADRANVGVG